MTANFHKIWNKAQNHFILFIFARWLCRCQCKDKIAILLFIMAFIRMVFMCVCGMPTSLVETCKTYWYKHLMASMVALASEEPPQWHDFITKNDFPFWDKDPVSTDDNCSSQIRTIVNMKINKILFLSFYFQVSVPSDFSYQWKIVAVCWYIYSIKPNPMFVRYTVQWVKFCVREQKNDYFISSYFVSFHRNARTWYNTWDYSGLG